MSAASTILPCAADILRCGGTTAADKPGGAKRDGWNIERTDVAAAGRVAAAAARTEATADRGTARTADLSPRLNIVAEGGCVAQVAPQSRPPVLHNKSTHFVRSLFYSTNCKFP